MGLSLGDEVPTQLYTCSPRVEWITDVQWTVTERLGEKWHLIMIMRHTCYLCSDLQTEELAQKFVFYAIIQLIYCRNWNLNCAVGELVLFNYTVVNDTWAYWNWFNREKEHRDLRGKRLLYKNKEGSQWYNTERKKERYKFEELSKSGCLGSIITNLN